MGSSQLLTAFFKSKITRAAIGLGIAATTAYSSLYTVNTGQRAVIFDRYRGSLLDKTVGEGTHFLIPWIQKPYIFDIRPRPHTFSSISAGTRDLHRVNLSLRVLARPDSQRLTTIFKSFGLEYEEKLLPSIGSEVVRDAVERFNAAELLADRSHFSALVRDGIVRRARNFGILLDNVAITHFSYDDGAEFYRKQEELKRQAYEEKIMQREREEERIEARKELLEAKRIAEENERKWILASRKAEEEKRARAKERIEADKKLLEAKQIAEENDRKRILSSGKVEEEIRAILNKIEQEKERIEADKKLLEEQQIAEENERKRILSLRKAEEEEKRARESFLKKIEQEKERIEAYKKLLEVKKIAKGNERKDNDFVIFFPWILMTCFGISMMFLA